MKHGFHLPTLGRNRDQRWNMIRQLVTHVFEHERISTTLGRAKLLRRYVDRTISLAKRGSESGRLKVFDIVNVLLFAFSCLYVETSYWEQGID